MKKRFAVIAMLAVACMLLSGCIGLGDLVYGLGDLFSGRQGESVPEPESVSLPQSSQPESISEPQSVSEPQPEPEAPGMALNADLVAFIGKTNGDVRAANGDDCYAYIMYGGAPVADYAARSVTWPVAFWLSVDQAEMMDVWGAESDGMGNAPERNIWRDSWEVFAVEMWGDAIPVLFGTESVPTYDELEQGLGQAPELEFTAANEGFDYSYSFDTWRATYTVDGLTMDAIFTQEGGERVLYSAMLYKM